MKAVYLDFDGVVADSAEFAKNTIRKYIDDVSDEVFLAHHDGNVYESGTINFTPENGQLYHEKFMEAVESVPSFFSPEQLAKICEKYETFVMSSNDEEIIHAFLDSHNMGCVKNLRGYESGRSKVEKFNQTFEEFDLEPEECVFVCDTLGDVEEGKKAGVRTIAVDFGFHPRERLLKGAPNKIVSSIEELMKELDL